MKRLLLLLSLAFTFYGLQAKILTPEQARKKAEEVLRKPTSTNFRQGKRIRAVSSASPAYLVFNAADGKGFAVVSTEDNLADILGYSEEHSFPLSGEMPCALSLYLDAFTQYAEAYANQQADATDGVPLYAGSPTQLCKTEWGQDAPYNALCPVINGRNCLTGCVATAMAQIMYYWKWPVQGKGYSAATDKTGGTYGGSLEHTYQWDAMLPTRVQLNQSEEAAHAVAELMYDCGLAVNMKYDPDGSGAGTPSKAFYSNFGYIPTTLRHYQRDCFTADEWIAIIRREIDHRRPVFHSASSRTNGGQDSGGHAFVVDGYDEVGNIRVNWGWNGNFDGFYAVERMNPGGYEFTVGQEILVGIEPAKNGEEGTPQEYLYIKNPLKCSKSGTISKSTSFDITVGNVYNPNALPHQWQLSVGIFDDTNTMLGEVKNGRISTLKLDANYYISGDFAAIPCLLKNTYPNGNYALRVVFRESGSKEWLLPDMAGGITKNAVYIQINGNKITFTDGADYIAVGVSNLKSAKKEPDLTRVFDTSGRLIYTAPSSTFNIWDIPARGTFIVKKGEKVQKVVR